MQQAQLIFLALLFFFNAYLFIKSKSECQNKNSFGLVQSLFPLGMFVWGDVFVLSLFWMVVILVSFILKDWLLFLVLVSSFWLVRSIGETIYWFLQQFATVKRDPPESLAGYRFVKNESIWFMYQVAWQCITVITLVMTVYMLYLWLPTLSA